jgi:hypothetical protein
VTWYFTLVLSAKEFGADSSGLADPSVSLDDHPLAADVLGKKARPR